MRLAAQLGVPQLSTGEMLRAEVAAASRLGAEVRAIMQQGGLVPDEVVLALIAKRIEADDARQGFILDGFPRTLGQAIGLDTLLVSKGAGLDRVLEIKIELEAMLERIITRAAEAVRKGEAARADDTPETLRRRLQAYSLQTEPLIGHYQGMGLLRSVDGLQSIEKVSSDLLQAIGA